MSLDPILNPLNGQRFPRIAINATPLTGQVCPIKQEARVPATVGAFTVLAPLAPLDGEVFAVSDADGGASTNTITVSGNTHTIDGLASAPIANAFGSRVFQFSTVDSQWHSVQFQREVVDGDGTVFQSDTAAAAGSTSTPGGADTDVQYNNAGAFGGDAGLTYDKAGALAASVSVTSPLVLATTDLQIGAAPRASAGQIRGPNASLRAAIRNALGTADLTIFDVNANELAIGGNMSFGEQFTDLFLEAIAGGTVQLRIGSQLQFYVDQNGQYSLGPNLGSQANGSQYSSHGDVTTPDPGVGGHLLTGAEVSRSFISFGTRPGQATMGHVGGLVSVPDPVSGAAFFKLFYNGCASSCTVKLSSGTGTGVSILTTKFMACVVTSFDVYQYSPVFP